MKKRLALMPILAIVMLAGCLTVSYLPDGPTFALPLGVAAIVFAILSLRE